MRFAYMNHAVHYRRQFKPPVFSTNVGVVEAVSRDEALGKAVRIALGVYPKEAGWCQHHSQVVDPENDPILEPGREEPCDPDAPLCRSTT